MKRNLGNILLACAAATLLWAASALAAEYIHVGPNWGYINELQPPDNNFDVRVKADTSFKLDEKMVFKVTSKKAGRLWVIAVDPDDTPQLLFPNPKSRDNEIEAGASITIPPADAGWAIQASEPAGKNILAFIVTTGDADLSDVLGGKDVKKAIRLVEETPAWGLGKLVIDVKKK